MDWAVDKKRISREKAIFMGKQLVSRRFGVSVDKKEPEFKVNYQSQVRRETFYYGD